MDIHEPDLETALLSPGSHTIFGIQTRILILLAAILCILATLLITLITYRVLHVLTRPTPTKRDAATNRKKGHLLIVLGSGGHTAEMLSTLQSLGAAYLNARFRQRTYVVSSGDSFSAERAKDFEWTMSTTPQVEEHNNTTTQTEGEGKGSGDYWAVATSSGSVRWDIVTVPRARRIHQSLLTTPWTALLCLRSCIHLLRGTHADISLMRDKHRFWTSPDGAPKNNYPDLILTNGPGTGVIVVLASLLLLIFGLAPLEGQAAMRSVYIESWARVRTLSLSGKILRWMVGRFLVQWPGLADEDDTLLLGASSTLASEDVNGSVMEGAREAVGLGVQGVEVGAQEEATKQNGITSNMPNSKEKQNQSTTTRMTTTMSTKRRRTTAALPRRIEYIGPIVT